MKRLEIHNWFIRISLSNTLLFIFIILSVINLGCEIIFEEDLSKQELIVISPPENRDTEQTNQLFWWEPVEGALDYHLQIVSGTFASPEQIVEDTILILNKHEVSLSPGSYQWRLFARNNYSKTEDYLGSLTIKYKNSLASKTIEIIAPEDNLVTTDSLQLFWWEQLNGASNYKLQIIEGSFEIPKQLVKDTLIEDNKLTVELFNGDFQWRVQAHGENDSTDFTTRTLQIISDEK